MPELTKEDAIKFLLDTEKVDVTQLLSDAVEYKKLHDRIDNGELVVKDDVDMSLSDDLVKQVSDHMTLSEEDKKNPGAVITKLIAKIVELAGTKTAVVDLQKQLSEMKADQEVGVLLSEKKIFPAEVPVFKKMWIESKGLYDEMAKVRVKPLIELSEIGNTVNEAADEKVAKEKKTSEEITRHFDAAKKERLVK